MNYTTLASVEQKQKAAAALEANHFIPLFADTKADALAKIKELIPAGASVMNGASKTLEQIGYIDYLKEGKHGWNNLHEAILAEADKEKQAALRKHSVVSDFYLGSVHALTEQGELVIASNTGSQLPHLAYTSQNVILIVGGQKIVLDIAHGLERIEQQVIPLEDARMREVYGSGTQHSKTLILRKENPFMGRNVYVVIVNESLGF
jgi:L-lactate utilization protein LutC